MALIDMNAKGNGKTMLLVLTASVAVLTIIVHLKNIRRMDEVEKSNGERLSILEEKVNNIENGK